jgi:hypothetical protein
LTCTQRQSRAALLKRLTLDLFICSVFFKKGCKSEKAHHLNCEGKYNRESFVLGSFQHLSRKIARAEEDYEGMKGEKNTSYPHVACIPNISQHTAVVGTQRT